MSAERRESPRIDITLDAFLNHGDRGFLRHTARNIGLDGVFLETDLSRLPRHALMELALQLPTEAGRRIHRFRARRVHATGSGAGLEFDRIDPDSYEALLELVFSPRRKTT